MSVKLSNEGDLSQTTKGIERKTVSITKTWEKKAAYFTWLRFQSAINV